MDPPTENPIVAYGRWLAETGDAWPDEAVDAAHRHFVDTISVTLRGAGEQAPRRTFQAVSGWGDGPCTVIGMGASLSAPLAALVNGTAAHALDFDDNFDPGKAHASAVLVPAILALAEQEALSGRACIDAYIAGLQITGRVGQGLNPTHRLRGWHATSTVGAIGASAACARLLRLDSRQAAYALSIATSMAGGFMSQFGTMTKPLHAGLAAKAGVMAATLARAGIDAGLDTLDGKTGMNRLMVGPDYEQLREDFARSPGDPKLRFETGSIGEPLFLLSHGLRVKRFPNCASAHRAMEALLELKERHCFTAAEVEQVVVRAAPRQMNNLMFTAPETDLEAKFSMEFALALILVDGDLTLGHFRPEIIAAPEVRDQFKKIVRQPFETEPEITRAEVDVTLIDGRRFSSCVIDPRGTLAAPFGWPDYWRKFDTCAEGLLDVHTVSELRNALEQLPALGSLHALMEPLGSRIGAGA